MAIFPHHIWNIEVVPEAMRRYITIKGHLKYEQKNSRKEE